MWVLGMVKPRVTSMGESLRSSNLGDEEEEEEKEGGVHGDQPAMEAKK